MNFDNYISSLQKNLERGSERTHYPALKNLLENSALGIEALIEETGNKAGIPDFTVRRRELLVGYIEVKAIGSNLDEIEQSEQLQRYQDSLPNLILTNYLEFRWYVDGKKRLSAKLGSYVRSSKTIHEKQNLKIINQLIEGFSTYQGLIISSPQDLAKQMARLTKSIKYAIEEALKRENCEEELHQLKRGFNEVLLPDLDNGAFADMYAQTICYGLFAARVSHSKDWTKYPFERNFVGRYIPETNPFLKRLFETLFETDALQSISWSIDDLVELLVRVDMGNILEDFGSRSHREDPVIHFYETFLAAYDDSLRRSRGVYYTPEPVVSYMVRSVDKVLKNQFNLQLGLADNAKDLKTQKPRVQILDPATGTGTFLYGVVNQIYKNIEEIGLVTSWNDYVKNNLLPRLYGFELLMAPYAIAHLKLGWQLQELGYQFQQKQRLGIYLTNTLDEALKKSDMLFGQFVAQEANDASEIKQNVPVMVVLGNPPYSGHSANKGEWIETLVQDYYQVDGVPLGERNPKYLQDDYVKFIRFGQWRINETGYGVLAFITNHGYLDNPTFRGMRQHLMQTFTEIYVLDLHGNSKKKEVCPDGSPDKNVFDIQTGVCIGIFIKEPGKETPAKVYHADLWGDQWHKYYALNRLDIETTEWTTVEPNSPFYLFYPQEQDLLLEYNKGWKITDIMPVNSTGVKTHRDNFVLDFERAALQHRIEEFRNLEISDQEITETYHIQDNRDWKISPNRRSLARDTNWETYLTECLYRPFDLRAYYHKEELVDLPRKEIMDHLQGFENLALLTMRRIREAENNHFFVSRQIVNKDAVSITDNCYVFPLYLYPDTANEQGSLFTERTANLSSDFITAIRQKLGYTPTPEAIFYYTYAIFHSPTYRKRYGEFLKIDFPRLPLTGDDKLFLSLGEKGEALIQLHLMQSKKLNSLITQYHGDGDHQVMEVRYQPLQGRIYINKQQYFEGIPPEVWEFKVGGYQVLDKWLKDRKKAKRSLSFDDILHYQRVVVALKETMQIMSEIDDVIPGWPLE